MLETRQKRGLIVLGLTRDRPRGRTARPFYGVIGGGSFTSSQKSPSCFTASTNFSNSTGFTT